MSDTIKKDYKNWMLVKAQVHNDNVLPIFKEAEVWWAAMGNNVGVEIDGKNEDYARPVIVFKKLSRFGFLAIPLTTQFHEGSWYVNFEFNSREEYAALAQIRAMSAARLYNRIGSLSTGDFQKIKEGFKNLIK